MWPSTVGVEFASKPAGLVGTSANQQNSGVLDYAVPFQAASRDAGLAWHYGDPLAEQRRLTTGVGSVDLSNRGVLRLSGIDRESYLNVLTTQQIDELEPGRSALTLNLNPQGFVLDELHVVADDYSLWISCESESRQDLLEYLTKMRFRAQVEIEDITDKWAVVWQPRSVLHNQYRTWVSPFASWQARELFVPRNEVDQLVGAAPAGMWAYEALRIAAGVPRQGAETDHHTLPHEVGWIRTAVHLNKGCYRGQETVSKVERMGKPPRRLTLLLLEGAEELPAHGDEVTFEGQVVGFVGAAVQHYELGPIASAVVKRQVPIEAQLVVAGGQAAQLAES